MNKRALANCGSAKFTAVQLQSSKAKSIDTMNSAHWKPFAIFLMLIEMCVYPQNVAHTRIWHGWIDVTAEPDALANKVGMHFFLSLNFRIILHFTMMLLTEHVINFKIGTLCIFHVYLKRFFLSLLFPLCMRNRFWWHTFMDAKKVITINTITKNRKKLHLKF